MLDTIANMPLSLSHSFFTVTILRSHVRSFFNLFSLFLDSTTVAYLHALALHGSHSFAFTASQPHCLNSISYQFSHFVPFLFLLHTFFLIDSVFFHAIFFRLLETVHKLSNGLFCTIFSFISLMLNLQQQQQFKFTDQ